MFRVLIILCLHCITINDWVIHGYWRCYLRQWPSTYCVSDQIRKTLPCCRLFVWCNHLATHRPCTLCYWMGQSYHCRLPYKIIWIFPTHARLWLLYFLQYGFVCLYSFLCYGVGMASRSWLNNSFSKKVGITPGFQYNDDWNILEVPNVHVNDNKRCMNSSPDIKKCVSELTSRKHSHCFTMTWIMNYSPQTRYFIHFCW